MEKYYLIAYFLLRIRILISTHYYNNENLFILSKIYYSVSSVNADTAKNITLYSYYMYRKYLKICLYNLIKKFQELAELELISSRWSRRKNENKS